MIKSLGEHYGYTPKEVGELTSWQIEALMSEDENDARSKAGNKTTMTIEEYRRFVRGG